MNDHFRIVAELTTFTFLMFYQRKISTNRLGSDTTRVNALVVKRARKRAIGFRLNLHIIECRR